MDNHATADRREVAMKTILVVDDEEHIRLLYQDEFTDMGYRVTLAASGEEALAAIDRERPGLITLDVKMEGMDGIEALRKIKEVSKNTPVILCTAYNIYKHDFGSWASDAYIVKSSNLDELKAKVMELLPPGE
jgi:CheY-like chemotaxis protein